LHIKSAKLGEASNLQKLQFIRSRMLLSQQFQKSEQVHSQETPTTAKFTPLHYFDSH